MKKLKTGIYTQLVGSEVKVYTEKELLNLHHEEEQRNFSQTVAPYAAAFGFIYCIILILL